MVTCSILFELKRVTLVLDTDNSVAAQAAKHFQLQAKQGQRKVFRVPTCEGSAEHGASACQEVHHPRTKPVFSVNLMILYSHSCIFLLLFRAFSPLILHSWQVQ